MNIDTPVFRGALTFGLIWLLVIGYLAYDNYRNAITQHNLSQNVLPEHLIDDCFDPQIDFEKEILRKPTWEETQSCLSVASEVHEKLGVRKLELSFKQSRNKFAFEGVLPVLSLLLMVAFWPSIRSTLLLIWRAYSHWLRFGRSTLRDKQENE